VADKQNKVNADMLDLFAIEVENHNTTMTGILLNFDNGEQRERNLEQLMHAAHSVRGAAKLVNVSSAVRLAHALEDCFVAGQNGSIDYDNDAMDSFIGAVDLLGKIGKFSIAEHEHPHAEFNRQLSSMLATLQTILASGTADAGKAPQPTEKNRQTEQSVRFDISKSIDPTLLELFNTELENNIEILSSSLLQIEESPDDLKQLENLMRASHSIKGAAKLVGIDMVVKLAHAMEDFFVAAQKTFGHINTASIDLLLQCLDTLKQIRQLSSSEYASWTEENAETLGQQIRRLEQGANHQPFAETPAATNTAQPAMHGKLTDNSPTQQQEKSNSDSVVRVSARRINRLMSLGGELSVTASWIGQYSSSMLNLKRKHNDMIDAIDRLRTIMEQDSMSDLQRELLSGIQLKAEDYRDALTGNIISLDDYDRRAGSLTSRLNHEIIASRMRPFRDGTQGYKRMVRDIARSLNKKVRLVIAGEDTQVDRDILEKIDAPINHMIRNAIDHGIESPEERSRAGKNEYGTIRLEASHSGGRLSIVVEDDGRGVDLETIRTRVLEKNLVNRSMAEKLSRSELLDFLFLPSFSTRDEVTELSGRGVGLDVVHSALQEMRGKLHSSTELGKGMHINLELPLTLSVVRSLLVEINGELYAFPLAAIHNVIKVEKSDIFILEDKQYISIDDQHIGLIHCAQILGLSNDSAANDYLSVVVIGDWNHLYGVVVDDLHGERGLALRPLNNRLGKVKDISAAAITDDGSPVLVFDVDDLILSIRDIVSGKDIIKVGREFNLHESSVKRVLVVDDSLTVREVEKKLLESRGYLVDVAVDGVDGWNAVRSGKYRLVISDVDMPRMNGIELVKLIKADAALRGTPVMMVSYKDRPEDRQKGMEAGADYYLTKGSFHDETLVEAVRDLIGDAT
jgi:two-component system sensor histidine kinase and response regulator WspE